MKGVKIFKGLWTDSYTYWWIVCFLHLLLFDIFWMLQTNFEAFSYFEFWPVLILGTFILSVPSLFLSGGKLQTLWLLFLDCVFLANLMYLRTYYTPIPIKSYSLASNLTEFSASIYNSYKWYYIFLPLLTAIGYLIFYFNKKIKRKVPSLLQWTAYSGVLVLIVFFCNIRYGGIKQRIEKLSKDWQESSSVVPLYTLGGYLWHDYDINFKDLKPEELDQVKTWLSEHENYTEPYWNDTLRYQRRKPRNLIVILCESLESWPLGKKIEGKEITPHLNRWLEDTTTFYAPNVVTQVGPGRSIDAQLLILSGMYPMIKDVYAYNAISNRYFSLGDANRRSKGSSILFTSDKPYSWNQRSVSRAMYTDTLIHGENFEIYGKHDKYRISDGSLMVQIPEKLEKGLWEQDERKMITVVAFSGHNPFLIPDSIRTISLEGKYKSQILKDYITAVNYTDSSLIPLIDYLQKRDDWEETMVVITGDHEGLGDSRKEASNDSIFKNMVDQRMHTPLIILNSPIAGRYDKEMGQADIYTTILDLMGWDKYAWKGMGWSIFDPDHPGVAYNSRREPYGDTSQSDPYLLNHLRKSRSISHLILKYDLLACYPDYK